MTRGGGGSGGVGGGWVPLGRVWEPGSSFVVGRSARASMVTVGYGFIVTGWWRACDRWSLFFFLSHTVFARSNACRLSCDAQHIGACSVCRWACVFPSHECSDGPVCDKQPFTALPIRLLWFEEESMHDRRPLHALKERVWDRGPFTNPSSLPTPAEAGPLAHDPPCFL